MIKRAQNGGAMAESFMVRRLHQILEETTTEALEFAWGQGMDEIIHLANAKPEGWIKDIDEIETTMAVIRRELLRREKIK
jgi:hypothetical protein